MKYDVSILFVGLHLIIPSNIKDQVKTFGKKTNKIDQVKTFNFFAISLHIQLIFLIDKRIYDHPHFVQTYITLQTL